MTLLAGILCGARGSIGRKNKFGADVLRLLFLEDDDVFGLSLTLELEASGFDVRWVKTADAAELAFQSDGADVFVSDIIVTESGVPAHRGGLTAIFRIRRIAKKLGQNLLIIAITGTTKSRGMEGVLQHARNMGSDAGLEKPFEPVELVDLINLHLKNRSEKV